MRQTFAYNVEALCEGWGFVIYQPKLPTNADFLVK